MIYISVLCAIICGGSAPVLAIVLGTTTSSFDD